MDGERRTLSFAAAAAWTVGLALIVQIAVAFTDVANAGARYDLVSVTACHVLGYSAIAFGMLRMYAPETSVREVIAFRRAPILFYLLAIVIGASLYPAANWLDGIVAKRFPLEVDETEMLSRLMAAPNLPRRFFIGVSLVVIMPILEEVYFRGILFGGLRRGRTTGMVIFATALYFAVARFDVRGFASVFLLGAILGWLRDRSKSIVPGALMQAAFFAVPIVPILRGRDPMEDDVYPRTWILVGLAAAVLSALALEAMRRARRGPDTDED